MNLLCILFTGSKHLSLSMICNRLKRSFFYFQNSKIKRYFKKKKKNYNGGGCCGGGVAFKPNKLAETLLEDKSVFL